jgi:hypothetical protein
MLGLHPILRKKGIYPYDWVDDYKKFSEKSLPPKEAFYNKLQNKPITDEEYKHAQEVWKVTNCTSFLDYHFKYLIADTVLLADVFENYRKTSLEVYDLDPTLFVSAPSLSWNAFLKFTKIEIEIPTDIELVMLIGRNMRGGICSSGDLYYANVLNKKDEHIICMDMNNLYGKAMMYPMPLGDYERIECSDFSKKYLLNYDYKNSQYGYFILCDIECPENIHDLVRSYPLFPEKIDGKLEASCYNKSEYFVHIAYLQYGLKLGYKLKKIHRVYRFKGNAK